MTLADSKQPSSSLLLSPEPSPEPGRPLTGTLLVAQLKSSARARLMGLPALRRHYPAYNELLSLGPRAEYGPLPSVGSGHGGQKLGAGPLSASALLVTPPARLNRPASIVPRPPSTLDSAASLPPSTPVHSPPLALPDDASASLKHISLPVDSCPSSQSGSQGYLPSSGAHKSTLLPSASFHTPPTSSQASQNPLSKHPMSHDDVSSNASSELEITYNPISPAQSRLESLLFARDSPSTVRASSSLNLQHSQTVPLDTSPQPVSSLHQDEMPDSFLNLLSLHTALERALLLHLATQGRTGAITVSTQPMPHFKPTQAFSRRDRMKTPDPEEYQPPEQCASEESTKIFRLENLVTWPALKPIVERSSSKQFGEKELAQLLWLWKNDPDDLSAQPIIPQQESGHFVGSMQYSGMGFIISTARSLEPAASLSRKQLRYTYGIGIEIHARENPQMPTFSLKSPGKSNPLQSPTRAPNRTSPRPQDGMNLIALWSSKSDERKAELLRRLNGHWLRFSKDTSHSLNIPLSELPCLNSSNQSAQSTRIFTTFQSHVLTSPSRFIKRHRTTSEIQGQSCVSSPEYPTAKRLKPSQDSPTHSPQSNVLPFHLKDIQAPNSNSSKTSTEKRALSLMERIRAKELAQKQSMTSQISCKEAQTISQSLDGISFGSDCSMRSSELRKKSMLSRLPQVIESIYMIFVPNFTPPSPSSSIPNPPTRKKPAMTIANLANLIVKSGRISLSEGEAMDLIKLLTGLCPEFLLIKTVDKEDWVMVPTQTDLRKKEVISDAKEIVRKALLVST